MRSRDEFDFNVATHVLNASESLLLWGQEVQRVFEARTVYPGKVRSGLVWPGQVRLRANEWSTRSFSITCSGFGIYLNSISTFDTAL